MTIICGLDLSLNAAAAVVCPLDWDGVWSRVSTLVVGEPLTRSASLADRARRVRRISRQLVAFARTHGVTHAYIEGYAFSMRSSSAHDLAELGHGVKDALDEAGIILHPANMGTARKLLLGKVPRTGATAKMAVYDAFVAAGKTFESLDESDAMCCANLGLSLHGGYFFGQEAAA